MYVIYIYVCILTRNNYILADVRKEERNIATSAILNMNLDSESDLLSVKTKENQISKKSVFSKSVKRKAKSAAGMHLHNYHQSYIFLFISNII